MFGLSAGYCTVGCASAHRLRCAKLMRSGTAPRLAPRWEREERAGGASRWGAKAVETPLSRPGAALSSITLRPKARAGAARAAARRLWLEPPPLGRPGPIFGRFRGPAWQAGGESNPRIFSPYLSGGNRTHDTWIKSPMLYQLSYSDVEDEEGIEPSTRGLRVRCSTPELLVPTNHSIRPGPGIRGYGSAARTGRGLTSYR